MGNLETVNLKAAITFRVTIDERVVAFTTKTFRGERQNGGRIPDPKQLVTYHVHSIVVDSAAPWFDLTPPAHVQLLWSNVLSVQLEPEARA